MRRTTSTVKRVQDLLTARKDRRFDRQAERQSRRFTAEGRAAHLEAENRDDAGFGAGQAANGGGGFPSGS